MAPFPTKSISKDPKAYVNGLKTVEDADKILKRAKDAYYNKAPVLTDDIYDLLVELIKHRFGSKSKVADAVGAPVAKGNKVELPSWMGSMNKIKGSPDQWKSKHGYTGHFVISDKLDGVSALLVGGQRMYSRGDGKVGQDISGLIQLVKGIPATVAPDTIVRGELIISKADFKNHLTARAANGRNLVSGQVNAKNPDAEVVKYIRFVAYAVIKPEKLSPSEQFALLSKTGFQVVSHTRVSETGLTFDHLSKVLMDRRGACPYEMDGLIVAHDAWHKIETDKNPEDAFAFKTLAMTDKAEVIVSEVEWNTSKDGLLKPTVIFEPVYLSGVTIRKATGHNADFVKTHVIGPGSKLLITRSGDVIPMILEAISPAASGTPQMPSGHWTWKGKDALAGHDTEEQHLRQLTYFFECLNIKGIGPGTVAKIYEAGHKTIPKVLGLTAAEVASVLGLQNRGEAIVADLKSSVSAAPCNLLMKASNCFGPGIGERKLAEIAKSIPSIVNVNTPPPGMDELLSVPGVSEITATKFLEGYAKFRKFVATTGLTISQCQGDESHEKKKKTAAAATAAVPQEFAGQKIVFTGFRNKKLEEHIVSAGGEIGSSVSKTTTLVVAKDVNETSSKLDKARTLNVPIVQLDDFIARHKITVA